MIKDFRKAKGVGMAYLILLLYMFLFSAMAQAAPPDFAFTFDGTTTQSDTPENANILSLDNSGILVSGNHVVNITNLVSMETTYYGLRVTTGGTVNLLNDVTLSSDGGETGTTNNAYLLSVVDAGSKLAFDGKLTFVSNNSINSSSENTYGAGAIEVGVGAELIANTGAEISITINGTRSVENADRQAAGIDNFGTTDLTKAAKVTITSDRATPAVRNYNGILKFGDNVSITSADAKNAHGVYSYNSSGKSFHLSFGDKATITGISALYLRGNSDNKSTIVFGNNAVLTATGIEPHNYGIYASDISSVTFGDNTTISGGTAIDLYSNINNHSIVTFGNNTSITGVNTGLSARSSGIVTFGNGTNVSGYNSIYVSGSVNSFKSDTKVVFGDNTIANAIGTSRHSNSSVGVVAICNTPGRYAIIEFGDNTKITSKSNHGVVAQEFAIIRFGDNTTILVDLPANDSLANVQAVRATPSNPTRNSEPIITFGNGTKVTGLIGVAAYSKSTISFKDDTTITATSTVTLVHGGTAGVEVNGDATISLGHRAKISGATAVRLVSSYSSSNMPSVSPAKLTILDNAIIEGRTYYGIFASLVNTSSSYGADTLVTIGNSARITGATIGLYTHNSSDAVGQGITSTIIGENATIASTGTTNDTYGIWLVTDGLAATNTSNVVEIGNNATISGYNGVFLNGGTLNFKGSSKITGTDGNGIETNSGGILTFYGKATIIGQTGIYINQSDYYDVTSVTFKDEASIAATAGNIISITTAITNSDISLTFAENSKLTGTNGIYLLGNTDINQLSIAFNKSATITVKGDSTVYGVKSSNSVVDFNNTTINSTGYGVVSSGAMAKISFEGTTRINSTGTGIVLDNNGTIKLDGSIKITTTGANANGIDSTNGMITVASGLQNIHITTSGLGSDALYFNNTADITLSLANATINPKLGNLITNASSTGTVIIAFTGESDLLGNIVGDVDISLEDTSKWRVKTSNALENGIVNLNLSDTAYWEVADNYRLNSVTMANDSRISFIHNNASYYIATIGTLSGTGGFILNIDMSTSDGIGDLLSITNAAGTFVLDVVDTSERWASADRLTVIEVLNAPELNALNITLLNGVEINLGGIIYELIASDDLKIWELVKVSVDPNITNGTNTSILGLFEFIKSIDASLSDEFITDKNVVWATANYKRQSFRNLSTADDMEQNIFSLTTGMGIASNDNWATGVFLSLTIGNQDVNDVIMATTNSFTIGLSGTYSNNGLIASGYVRLANYIHSIEVVNKPNMLDGSISTFGISASAQVIKPFYVSSTSLFIAPKAKLTYTHLFGFGHDFGLINVAVKPVSAFVGWIGFRAGIDLKIKEIPVTPYIESGYIYDMNPEITISIDGDEKAMVASHSRYEFGAGFKLDHGISSSLTFEYKLSVSKNMVEPIKIKIEGSTSF